MKKITTLLAVLIFIVPSVSFAAGLTQNQVNAIISVLEAFGVDQTTLVAVENALAPSAPETSISSEQTTMANDCNGSGYPACLDGYHFFCPSSGSGYCVSNTTTVPISPIYGCMNSGATNYNSSATSQMGVTCTYPPPISTNPVNQPNAPWVNITADGSNGPITTPINGPAVTISWASKNVIGCTLTDTSGVITSVGTSGSKSESFPTLQKDTITVQCSALVNNVVTPNAVSDSVTINAIPPTGQTPSVSVSFVSSPVNASPYVSSVRLASFNMLANDENVKVTDLYICSIDSIHNGGLANGKIYYRGVQVSSTQTIADCGTTPSGTDFSLSSSLILPAGVTTDIDIYGDMKTPTGTGLSNGETVQIKVVGQGSQGFNGQGQSSLNSYAIPSSDVLGGAVSVVASTLSASPGYSCSLNQTNLGTQSACLGSFTLSAGSTEGIDVNTIAIDMSAANATLIKNLTLKDHATGTVLGTVITTPSTSNSYAVNFDVPTTGTSIKTIDIYGNVPQSASAIQLTLDPSTSGTGDITGQWVSIASPVQLRAVTIQ
ncbi:MAG: hypothetical protein ABSB00_03035 [Minisyncoccia bacterium]